MNQIKIYLLILIIFSCNSNLDNNVESKNLKSATKKIIESAITTKLEIKKQGFEELKLIKSIKESVNILSIDSLTRIVVYELNNRGEPSGAESVFRKRTGLFKELRIEDTKEFIDLINDKASYGAGYADCHTPKLGIVFYDNSNPIFYSSLCLACNNMYSRPEIDLRLEGTRSSGFNKEARKRIRKIIEKWGFRDESISTLFDDEESIREILIKQDSTEKEIKKEFDEIKN